MGITYQGFPLYFDCGNDAGLAVAGFINFPGYAQYEDAPVRGKTNVAAYEFPAWVAANFATVDEVEEALSTIAIVGKPVSDSLGVSLLHWIIGDAKRSIVIEYLPTGMQIHPNPVDTLANQPTFDWHMENLRTYLNATSAFPGAVQWGNASLSPFGAGAGAHIPGDSYTTSLLRQGGFPECQLSCQAVRAGKRYASVSHIRKCSHGRGVRSNERRHMGANHLHELLLGKNGYVLLYRLRQSRFALQLPKRLPGRRSRFPN